MELKDLKLNRLLYDPSKDTDLIRLKKEYVEFNTPVRGLEANKILRYVILMYDRNSELREEYPNIHQRKAIAAQLAGFSLNKNRKFPEVIEEMLLGKIKEVNIMIVKYILLYPDPDALALEVYYEMIVRQSTLTMGKIADPREYKDILANTENLRKKISELTQSVFGGDELNSIKRELYGMIEEKRTAIRPEDIAEKIEKGLNPIDENPYGDYKPEPIKLISKKEYVFKG